MKDLRRRVALVTGAASGLGLGLARRFAAEGMRLVMIDVDETELEVAATQVERDHAEVEAVVADVADRASVKAVVERAYDRFGSVDVLCSNAGVAGPPGGWLWEIPAEEWDRVFAVNAFGLVNMLSAFVPRMIESGRAGHIVVTASIAGFASWPTPAQYLASKHAAVSIAETLRLQIAQLDVPIKVTLLAPGPVATRIMEREQAHADAVGRPLSMPGPSRPDKDHGELLRPEEVAARVLDAIHSGSFYVFTHPKIQRRQVLDRIRPVLSSLGLGEHGSFRSR